MSDRKVVVVTTCNKVGYAAYGKKMLDTFSKLWDRNIQMYFYNEDAENLPQHPNVEYRPFPAWFLEWKERHRDHKFAHGKDHKRNRKTREYDFRLDCVKFSHKVAAMTDVGSQVTDGLLLWIDADTVTHQHVDVDWLYSIYKKGDSYIAWLERKKLYPECGFILFRTWMECHLPFMELLLDTYRSDRVFEFEQTHDSYIIHQLVLRGIKEGWMPKPHNISGNYENKHHPFVFSMLGDRLDHAKGARKNWGRTLASELKGKRRPIGHWKP